MPVAPGKEGNGRQAADDDDLEDQYGGPHDPVESHDARTVVLTDFTTFGARQTLVGSFFVINATHSLF